MNLIDTPAAPAAVGPFSQAIRSGDLLFVSGQLPVNPLSGAIDAADSIGQLHQCMANIRAIAEAAGTDLAHAVKVTVLLTDISEFGEINAAYQTYFTAPYPARLCYQVSALPKGARVEVDAIIEIPKA